ncbi:hypothetical protein INT48_007018 [Thamnidium elegans]|uniref:Uncharacterized protein n=1 Tax=Thamnidium elegans TaxID=101142 RepID=A0A8H7STS2_9FUNG|nr:hypothetical protein INT48_007018 [Thamnidium elegans]
MKPNSRLPFKIASTPGCMSVGDVIRELDALQLVSSELNSNMKLENLLEEHRARKKSYRNPIMTMVLKEEILTHTLTSVQLKYQQYSSRILIGKDYVQILSTVQIVFGNYI